jgi:hypothetical protein
MAGMKTCEDCGGEREDTPLNFPVFRKRRMKCLSCVVKRRRLKADQRKEKRAREMQRLEDSAVDAMLAGSKRGGSEIPHSAELLEQVMHCFGGVNGFSNLLMKNYFDSAPGGPQRTKILELITKLVTTNASQGGSKKPLMMWSEEELNEELDARLQQAVEQFLPPPAVSALPVVEEVTLETPAEHSDTDQ